MSAFGSSRSQKDPLEIFRAAAAAEKIRDHVLTFEQEQQQSQENAAAVRAEGEGESMASQPVDPTGSCRAHLHHGAV